MKFPFHPKLLDTLPGYGKGQLSHDVSAGLTVGVLALPLAMAFAIASGMSPTAGIWTAIVAGFIISTLGGSRVHMRRTGIVVGVHRDTGNAQVVQGARDAQRHLAPVGDQDFGKERRVHGFASFLIAASA